MVTSLFAFQHLNDLIERDHQAIKRRCASMGDLRSFRWVTVNCLHPGFVATRFGDGSGGLPSYGVRLAKTFAISPEKGAQTIVYLASSPEVAGASGEYFYQCRPATPTTQARDDAAAQRLWIESAKLAGIET